MPQVEAMRGFAGDARPDNHVREASLSRPLFGAEQQQSADSGIAMCFRNHQAADLGGRARLQMMRLKDVDPGHHGAVAAGGVRRPIGRSGEAANALFHSGDIDRIAEFGAELGNGAGIGDPDRTDFMTHLSRFAEAGVVTLSLCW